MTLVVDFLVYLCMEFILYNIGRVTIFLFSFGHLRFESLREMMTAKNITAGERNTNIVIPASACQIIGMVVFTVSLMLLLRFGS
jgi:uncharacterized membrane protein